jgi:hypothetical protein
MVLKEFDIDRLFANHRSWICGIWYSKMSTYSPGLVRVKIADADQNLQQGL